MIKNLTIYGERNSGTNYLLETKYLVEEIKNFLILITMITLIGKL